MFDYQTARDLMVERQLRRRGIADEGVLKAMAEVPREAFVEQGFEEFAYEDSALPIAEGQTISQPYIVGFMAEAADIAPTDRVLEIGGGSGYGAAIVSRLAREVFVVERLPRLVQRAERRWRRLGYDNIHIRCGDGTKGWAEQAPFDAIIVTAGGPDLPPSLQEQLAVGGVMVIPVGERWEQQLRRIRRVSETKFDSEDIGFVVFVPLIGEEGWTEDGRRAASDHAPGKAKRRTPSDLVAEAAIDLPTPEDDNFAAAFDRFGTKRVVLLGEATHGTSEFYRARATISKWLIDRHAFSIVAVEADWPDAASIDRYVRWNRHRPGAAPAFQRFPTWMWRNVEFAEFAGWLRAFNAGKAPEARAAFYGLDMYSLSESIAQVLSYLDKEDPAAAAIARERYGCLTPWQSEPAAYGRAVRTDAYRKCEREVVAQCEELLKRRLSDGEALFDAAQNARLVAAAERYYRIMYYGGSDSWNLRDTHMFETLEHVLDRGGAKAKAVVWAHNSHIGDARFTDMGAVRGELNIGQLCREKFGDEAALIGFGTDRGTVAAADDWDGDMKVKRLKPSRADSVEAVVRGAARPRALLDFGLAGTKAATAALAAERLERFVGVIYRPDTEYLSHYAEASLSRQFDAYVWFEETMAVHPLGPDHPREGEPETYPFGL